MEKSLTIHFRKATRNDVPNIVRLLADDQWNFIKS